MLRPGSFCGLLEPLSGPRGLHRAGPSQDQGAVWFAELVCHWTVRSPWCHPWPGESGQVARRPVRPCNLGAAGRTPTPRQAALTRMPRCAHGERRQPGRRAWSDGCVSATGTPRAQAALVFPRPLFAGLTREEGAGGGTTDSGLRPEALRARACAHVCARVCVCGRRGVEERQQGRSLYLCARGTYVCLSGPPGFCVCICTCACAVSPGECVSFRERVSTWRCCVLSVARGCCGHTSRGRCSLWLWAGLCVQA